MIFSVCNSPDCHDSDMAESVFVERPDRKHHGSSEGFKQGFQKSVKKTFISIREMRRLGLSCCVASLHPKEKVPLLLQKLLNAFVPGFLSEVDPPLWDQIVLGDVVVYADDPVVYDVYGVVLTVLLCSPLRSYSRGGDGCAGWFFCCWRDGGGR